MAVKNTEIRSALDGLELAEDMINDIKADTEEIIAQRDRAYAVCETLERELALALARIEELQKEVRRG